MNKYVLAYHGSGDMPDTEEGVAEVMGLWQSWFAGLGAAVVDGGNPIATTKTVNTDGSISAGGGANPITGYSIVNADSMEAACALAQGCPVLQNDGTVEVAEAIDM